MQTQNSLWLHTGPRNPAGQSTDWTPPYGGGENIRDIAKDTSVSYFTARDGLVRMHNGYLDSRFDVKRERCKRSLPQKVDESIIKWPDSSPKDYGFDVGTWQLVMIRRKIQATLAIDRKVRTLRRDLRRLGFSYHKPRPVPHNSATPEEQAKFKLETNHTVTKYVKEGYTVVTHSTKWQDSIFFPRQSRVVWF